MLIGLEVSLWSGSPCPFNHIFLISVVLTVSLWFFFHSQGPWTCGCFCLKCFFYLSSSLIHLRGLALKTFPWKVFSVYPVMDTFSHRTWYSLLVTLDFSELAKADPSYCYRNMGMHSVLLIFNLWVELSAQ